MPTSKSIPGAASPEQVAKFEATSQQSKAKPSVLVVSAESTSMSNFPTSVENAQFVVQAYLEEQLKAGYKYAGTITRDVGSETRSFLVFYPIH